MNTQDLALEEKLQEIAINFPHVSRKIQATWGTSEGRSVLLELLSDTRGGTRAGFPTNVAKSIFALLTKHDIDFPKFDSSDQVIVPFKGRVERVVQKPKEATTVPWQIKLVFWITAAIFVVRWILK